MIGMYASSEVVDYNAWMQSMVVAFDERNASPLDNVGTLGATGNATATGTKVLSNTDDKAYVYCYGATVGQLTVASPSELTGATQLDIRLAIAPDDWTPSTNVIFISHGGSTASISSFRWIAMADGRFRIEFSNGTSFVVTQTGAGLLSGYFTKA